MSNIPQDHSQAGASVPIVLLTEKLSCQQPSSEVAIVPTNASDVLPILKDPMAVDRDLYDAITRDALTGAMNFHFFGDHLYREISRAVRQQAPLSILMIVARDYAEIQDSDGKAVADEIIRDFGCRILSECRDDDVVSRIGIDRFGLVLAATGREEAMTAVDHFRSVVSTIPFKTESGERAVKSQIGAATLNPASPVSSSSLLSQAVANLH